MQSFPTVESICLKFSPIRAVGCIPRGVSPELPAPFGRLNIGIVFLYLPESIV